MAPHSRILYQHQPRGQRSGARFAWFALAAFSLLALVGAGLWYGVRLQYLRVGEIQISGADAVPPSRVEAVARGELSGANFLIVPRDNFFAVPADSIAAAIRAALPQLASVSVKKHFPNRLEITIRERALWGLACVRGESGGLSDCAYVDSDGVAYEPVSRIAGWLLPVLVSAEPARIGAEAVSQNFRLLFSQASAALAPIGGPLLWLAVATATPNDVRLGLAEGWEAIVSLGRPVSEWRAALETLLNEEIGNRRASLEYVDLRFGSKIFYKYK